MHLAKKLAASVLALSLTALLPSCDAGITSPSVDRLGANPPTVRLERSELQLVAGDTARLTAQLVSAGGSPLSGQGVSWSSSAPEVVSVGRDGAVSALRAGEATVTASAGQASATARVRVSSRVAVLRISPKEDTLNSLGATVALAATVLDPSGQPVPTAGITWSSLDPAVAIVDAEGQVTSLGAGVARITGGSGGKTDTVRVHVKPGSISVRVRPKDPVLNALGDTLRLLADGQDANGRALDPAAVKWTSLSPAVATVEGAGLVTARGVGTARVAAEFGGRADTTTVTVRQLVASVAVTPGAPVVQAGQAQQMVAAAKDSNGNDVPGVTFAWMSSNPAAATVSGAGLVSAAAPGVSYVTATAGSRSGTATVTVTANPGTVPARIAVEPEAATLDALGASAQLGATVYSAAGGAMAGIATSWSSLDAGIATVDGAGRVTARAVGTARIVATAGALADTAVVTVRQVVASIAVTPGAPTLQEGGVQQLAAAASDANGNAVPVGAFAWTSSNPAAATVDAAGVVRAVAAGVSYVTASAGGRTATATVTVAAAPPAPVATVSVAPGSAAVVVGGSVLATASARDAAGNLLTGRAVAWSSSNPAVATVSASGMVTGAAPGSATITATVEGKTGTAAVTVSADPATTPARIAVSPRSDTLGALGAATQLRATVYSASGGAMSGAATSWTSLSAGVATVDAAGRVTAVAAGTARVVAASGPLADTATIVVRQVVASVAVSPSAPVVQEGATQQVAATAKDANGNAIAGVAFTWTSSNPAAATVNGSGLVSAVAAGVSYVTAGAGGKSAVATVTVSAPAVATVSVSPGSASLAVGGTVDLSAVARDGAGRILTGRAVAWASSNPAVATVSATGLVTGVAGGTATITATSEGKSGTAAVTVSAPAAPVGSTVVYAHNFNDGTIGAFGQWGGYTPKPVSIIADPTGSGRGSVAKVVYERDSAGGGSVDVNG
ncbi:MAG TPA: Ig-like domain-containing protein, partial [Longimicrobiaceae bacterium]